MIGSIEYGGLLFGNAYHYVLAIGATPKAHPNWHKGTYLFDPTWTIENQPDVAGDHPPCGFWFKTED